MTKTLKDLLPTILQQKDNWKFNLLNNWHTIFGDLSSKVTLEKIQHDTLILGVQDSCWLQELYLLSPMLLKTINKTLDASPIKQLRFKTTGIKHIKPAAVSKKSKECTIVVTLNSAQLTALEQIKDPQLRESLKNFLVRCYRERT